MLFKRTRIIRPERYVEQVLAVHSGVHHEFSRNRCTLTRSQSRRTDDGAGRSAPFHDADRRIGVERERAVTAVGDLEFGAHRFVKRLFAEINPLSIYREARTDFSFAGFSVLSKPKRQRGDDKYCRAYKYPDRK